MVMYRKTSFLLLFLLCSCSLLRSYDERTFNFNYAGNDYEIVSKIQGDDVLENLLLTYNENGEIILEGVDEDSDGELDELRRGEISISEANRIYYAGIEQALESGNFDSKNELRLFEFTNPPYIYSIETVGYDDFTSRRRMVYGYLKEVAVYNQFSIVQTEEETEIIVRDMDSDGILDTPIAPENLNLSDFQAMYRDIIDKGLNSDRIVLTEQMYIVLPNVYN